MQNKVENIEQQQKKPHHKTHRKQQKSKIPVAYLTLSIIAKRAND